MNLTPKDDHTSRLHRDDDDGLPRLGQWYWVTSYHTVDDRQGEYKAGDSYEWFGCVTQVGSNYVLVEEPRGDTYKSTRIHIDQVESRLRLEKDPDTHIATKVAKKQDEIRELMNEVTRLTASLGLSQGLAIDVAGAASEQSKALAVLSGQVDVKSYELALTKAKAETLPELFKAIEEANKGLAKWLQASALPMLAQAKLLKGALKTIDDRIFNISLYAGLTEQVVQVREGDPAPLDAKLHVLQRRHYMDEECLLEYENGGMEFRDIKAFDEWMAREENLTRLLPFDRCLIAMRVRRDIKVRDHGGNLMQAFINFQISHSDKFTFLYIRNGNQLWRMNCDQDFGEKLFPDETHLDPTEPLMVRMFINTVSDKMSLRLFEIRCREREAILEKREAWRKANPDRKDWDNPHSTGSFNPKEWKPFDHSNVHYDEVMAGIHATMREYNRIALVIQGLFDRSMVLHPHAPVRSWTAEGFETAITLVRDADRALYAGDKPDFEAYRARVNSSLDEGSIVYGADDFWAEKEAIKECARRDRDWRDKSAYRPERFRPYGNPGPGILTRIETWSPRARKATFRWLRDKANSWRGEKIACSLTVPESRLFNVSAYQPGDFKQFFADPRTRAEYLKWAPMLLAAEEFHAGNRPLE
jgi:hypothetical protein